MHIPETGNDSITDRQSHSARRADREHCLSDLQGILWGQLHRFVEPGFGLAQVQFEKLLAAVKDHENTSHQNSVSAPGDDKMLPALKNVAIRNKAPGCNNRKSPRLNSSHMS